MPVITARQRALGAIVVLLLGLGLVACSSGPGTPGNSAGSHTGAASTPVGAHSSGPGSGAPTATAAGSGNPGPVSMCQTAQLKISIGATGAVAGTSGGDLLLRNQGRTACQLAGWPTLIAVTAGGSTATAVHVRTTQFGPFGGTVAAVTISPGAVAGAAFAVGANGCAASYRSLRVTPPGNRQNVVISAWLPQINTYLPACAPVEVSPVVPASALKNPAPQP